MVLSSWFDGRCVRCVWDRAGAAIGWESGVRCADWFERRRVAVVAKASGVGHDDCVGIRCSIWRVICDVIDVSGWGVLLCCCYCDVRVGMF